jgi:hypothetical protein
MSEPRGRKPGNAKERRGRTAPGKLTPQGGNHKESTETLTQAVRMARAVKLYTQDRLSMQAIADLLTSEGTPVTAKTICLDLHRAFDEANASKIKNVAIGQQLEAARLDHLDQQLLPIALGDVLPDKLKVGRGKTQRTVDKPLKQETLTRLRLDALAQLRRNGESRRKLFGWDATPDDGFIRVDQVVTMVRGLISDILELTEDNATLRRQVAKVMRQRFGLIEAHVVEVEPI